MRKWGFLFAGVLFTGCVLSVCCFGSGIFVESYLHPIQMQPVKFTEIPDSQIQLISTSPLPTPSFTSYPTLFPSPTYTPIPDNQGIIPAIGCRAILFISEILYDPLSKEPDGEWVEIYNPGNCDLSLKGYKLGDEETLGQTEGMLLFPDNSILRAKRAFVIAQNGSLFLSQYGFKPDFQILDSEASIPVLQKYVPWSKGRMNLNNSGDEVLLLDEQNNIIDAVAWGKSTFSNPKSRLMPVYAPGHSLERAIFQSGKIIWHEQAMPNPGKGNGFSKSAAANKDNKPQTSVPHSSETYPSTPTPIVSHTETPPPTVQHSTEASPTQTPAPFNGRLLISEVCFDPLDHEPDGEWIEIYNPENYPIDLSGFKIGDEETKGQSEGIMQFPSGAIIESRGVVIIANHAEPFLARYGFQPQYEMNESNSTSNMTKYSSWAKGSVSLNNSGDEVILLDGADRMVDVVSWGNSTSIFNPAVATGSQGSSIARIPADTDTNTASDWYIQLNPNPGIVLFSEISRTPTRTQTVTKTPRNTSTPTSSKTSSPASTPTLTRTLSPSITPVPTKTPTKTPSPAPTPTSSRTLSPSLTPTLSKTPTRTPSPSSTPSPSKTPILTKTSTFSPTPTWSASPSTTPKPSPSSTLTPSTPIKKDGKLLISEVYYAPADINGIQGYDPNDEWIEIFNPSFSDTIDLSGYKVGDAEYQLNGEAMFRFPSDSIIEPRQIIVVAYLADRFYERYSFKPDFEIQPTDDTVPDMSRYYDWASPNSWISLNNNGDEVLILDREDIITDAISWGYSQVFLNPSIPLVASGHSIERIPKDQDIDSSIDWIYQAEPNPGD